MRRTLGDPSTSARPLALGLLSLALVFGLILGNGCSEDSPDPPSEPDPPVDGPGRGTWSRLPTGSEYSVRAFGEHGGELYTHVSRSWDGGELEGRIVRLDRNSWTPISGRVGNITSLVSFRGDLVASGKFESIGDVAANRVARWDGESWHPLGRGMYGIYVNTWVGRLLPYNGDLIAGGLFSHAGESQVNHLARWDGTEWHPLGAGVPIGMHALGLYQSDLIVGGSFDMIDGIPANRVARWDGVSWHAMGAGLGIPESDSAVVWEFEVYDDKLIACGRFYRAGGEAATGLAAWDGIEWSPYGGVVDGYAGVGHDITGVVRYGELLIIGGRFERTGSIEVSNLAAYDSRTDEWFDVGGGVNAHVREIFVFDGKLYVGGEFTMAGDLAVDRVAVWTDSPVR